MGLENAFLSHSGDPFIPLHSADLGPVGKRRLVLLSLWHWCELSVQRPAEEGGDSGCPLGSSQCPYSVRGSAHAGGSSLAASEKQPVRGKLLETPHAGLWIGRVSLQAAIFTARPAGLAGPALPLQAAAAELRWQVPEKAPAYSCQNAHTCCLVLMVSGQEQDQKNG